MYVCVHTYKRTSIKMQFFCFPGMAAKEGGKKAALQSLNAAINSVPANEQTIICIHLDFSGLSMKATNLRTKVINILPRSTKNR